MLRAHNLAKSAAVRWLLIAAALQSGMRHANAQSYTVVHNFLGPAADGRYPLGSLTLSNDGTLLYGMTRGSNGGGVVAGGVAFSFNPAGNLETVLHDFSANTYDASHPEGNVVQSGSDLYGFSQTGGDINSANGGDGTIFVLNTTNNAENVLYSFGQSPVDATAPIGSPIISGNTIYGMTPGGGGNNYANGGDGTIFSFNTATLTENVLYSFGANPTDGIAPKGSLLQSGNTFYGMTSTGGTASLGTIFSFDPSTNTENVLHSFAAAPHDGYSPQGSLIQAGNTLYGMTEAGGANGQGGGTIFSFNTITDTETILKSLGTGTGFDPQGSLIQSGDMLYGMTNRGGTSDFGVIFSFDTDTDAYTILHSFTSATGEEPFGDLVLDGSTLYGMTEIGGSAGYGVIFSQSIPEPATISVLLIGAAGMLLRRGRR
jgi:uncharacterized repeat protein (TIGR03803 family)